MSQYLKEFVVDAVPMVIDAQLVDGAWNAMVGIWSKEPQFSVGKYPDAEAAIEAADRWAKIYFERARWEEEFKATTDDLCCGETDWEVYETQDQGWAATEWLKRDGRTGRESALKSFSEAPEEYRAKYAPGTPLRVRYDKWKADWEVQQARLEETIANQVTPAA